MPKSSALTTSANFGGVHGRCASCTQNSARAVGERGNHPVAHPYAHLRRIDPLDDDDILIDMAKRILIADDSVTIQKAFAMTFAGSRT